MTTDAGQVTDGDITIDSNHETAEQISAAFETDDTPVADAAPAEPAAPVEKRQNRRESATEAVSSAVGKQRAAERRAEAAEARIAELSRQPEPEPVAAPAPGSEWARFKAMPGVPTVDQFDAYEDYSMAMAAFVADVRHHERDVERAQSYQQHQYEQTQQAQTARWNERLQDARSENPNLDSSLNPDTPMSLPMQHLAMDSPVGIQILQWLSAHPDESQRISTLHPAETYREMGKLEARLEAAPLRASARVVSNAKPPIRPLGTSPHVTDAFAVSDDTSFDEHFRRMNASDRARGRL